MSKSQLKAYFMRLLYPKSWLNVEKKTREIIYAAVALITSIFIIFWQFPEIPKNLDFDEVEFARLALDLEGKPYTPYHPYATGHTTLYYYLLLFSFKIFGVNNFALRFPSAFFGVLSVLAFFLLIKSLKLPSRLSDKLLLFAPVFLATQRWFFNFARFGYEATFLLLLELLSLAFLFRYINKSKKKALFLSGVFTGLTYNSYAAGRIFFLLPAIILALHLYKKRKVKDLYLWITPLFLLTLPLNLYFLTQGTEIRAKQQIFFLDPNLNLQEKMNFLYQNIKNYILMFFYKGDINGRHNYPGKPALSFIQIPLLLAGLLFAFKNRKKISQALLLFLLWSIFSLFPPLLTYPWENPNMLRTFTLTPTLSFLFSLSIFFISDYIAKKNPKNIWFIFVAIALFNLVYELRTYFVFQKQVFKYAFIEITPLEKLYKLGKLKIKQ